MTLESGERQVAPTVDGIRPDHIERYEWAARFLQEGSRVADFACGVGYGCSILAGAGLQVQGFDKSQRAILYARQHYPANHARYIRADGDAAVDLGVNTYDAVVCFETIEHIEDPLPMLRAFREAASVLLISVPNEAVFPNQGQVAFHHRHYTKAELEALLAEAGWRVTEWHGQAGPESPVQRDCEGRTLIAVAKRDAPESVAILGTGAVSRRLCGAGEAAWRA